MLLLQAALVFFFHNKTMVRSKTARFTIRRDSAYSRSLDGRPYTPHKAMRPIAMPHGAMSNYFVLSLHHFKHLSHDAWPSFKENFTSFLVLDFSIARHWRFLTSQ